MFQRRNEQVDLDRMGVLEIKPFISMIFNPFSIYSRCKTNPPNKHRIAVFSCPNPFSILQTQANYQV